MCSPLSEETVPLFNECRDNGAFLLTKKQAAYVFDCLPESLATFCQRARIVRGSLTVF